ncbi:hypothetical protein BY458DRAFT_521469 [Sporodiniella umbellata]|nr:hypothetical protein BY458DRAFT_521469 [Sporodiniella umbellata]
MVDRLSQAFKQQVGWKVETVRLVVPSLYTTQYMELMSIPNYIEVLPFMRKKRLLTLTYMKIQAINNAKILACSVKKKNRERARRT